MIETVKSTVMDILGGTPITQQHNALNVYKMYDQHIKSTTVVPTQSKGTEESVDFAIMDELP